MLVIGWKRGQEDLLCINCYFRVLLSVKGVIISDVLVICVIYDGYFAMCFNNGIAGVESGCSLSSKNFSSATARPNIFCFTDSDINIIKFVSVV